MVQAVVCCLGRESVVVRRVVRSSVSSVFLQINLFQHNIIVYNMIPMAQVPMAQASTDFMRLFIQKKGNHLKTQCKYLSLYRTQDHVFFP